MLEGAFPNYKKVIPSQTANPLYINKEVLRGGLNRAAVLASDRNPLVKMNITKELVMVTGSNEQEEAVEELEAEYSGSPLKSGLMHLTYKTYYKSFQEIILELIYRGQMLVVWCLRQIMRI